MYSVYEVQKLASQKGCQIASKIGSPARGWRITINDRKGRAVCEDVRLWRAVECLAALPDMPTKPPASGRR